MSPGSQTEWSRFGSPRWKQLGHTSWSCSDSTGTTHYILLLAVIPLVCTKLAFLLLGPYIYIHFPIRFNANKIYCEDAK